MNITRDEIIETIRMVQAEQLDIRTVTLGISLRDCADPSILQVSDNIYDKLMAKGKELGTRRLGPGKGIRYTYCK